MMVIIPYIVFICVWCRGTPITYARDCPGFGIYFASYEYMAHAMSSDGTMAGLASWQLLIAGGEPIKSPDDDY
jgi:hypothetical protein